METLHILHTKGPFLETLHILHTKGPFMETLHILHTKGPFLETLSEDSKCSNARPRVILSLVGVGVGPCL